MCGIAGIIGACRAADLRLDERIAGMVEAQNRRGPDGAGQWLSRTAPVALGHRRLAIIDLSAAGHQPMTSVGGRHVITYNGELYNFTELRHELDTSDTIAWRGHSDTEVMIESVARWGIVRAVSRFNGMFAFALWDAARQTVSLVRDRFGVKPLLVARSGDGAVIFGSEARALAADPLFPAKLNREAVRRFLGCGYVPHRRCIYCDAVCLAPGSLVTFAADATEIDWLAFQLAAESNPDGPFDLAGRGWHYRTYWSAEESQRRGQGEPFRGDFGEAVTEGERLLSDAVRRRMVADVPLGALLSGGVDSSLVVALMQRHSTQRVRTFSIGFSDESFDESRHAQAVAGHVGTEHMTLQVGRDEAMQVISRLGTLLDEPLADPSFIPTYLVSQLTRRHVTVAMTGDGGDEFFGGYWRYRYFRAVWLAYAMPAVLRRAVDTLARRLEVQPPVGRGPRWVYFRLLRLCRLAAQRDFAAAYRYGTAMTLPVTRLLRDDAVDILAGYRIPDKLRLDPAELMMLFDILNYLPDDLLVKVDRASMAVSLECREPLLDYRLHEFSCRLPLGFKLEHSVGKRLLREVLYRHVPRSLVDRPKKGFGVPLERWLRQDLKACVEETLFSGDRADSLFVASGLRELWDEHQTGRKNHKSALWKTFVLKRWLADHRWT